jgi:hypothetical protein
MKNMEDRVEEVDVAVIGAGPAGAFVAWRMAAAIEHGTNLEIAAPSESTRRIRLYESSARPGGRLESIRMKTLPSIAVELGAEGYLKPPAPSALPPVYPGHVLVARLVQEMNAETLLRPRRGLRGVLEQLSPGFNPLGELQLDPDPISAGGPTNPLYLRGKRFPASKLTNKEVLPYQLTEGERASLSTPQGIVGYAYDRILYGATRMSASMLKSACRQATWKGKPLSHWAIGEILKDESILSQDGFQFVLDTSETPNEYLSFNACDAIFTQLTNDLAPLQQLHLREGYEALPKRIIECFERAPCARTEYGHMLQELHAEDDSRMLLRFAIHGSSGGVKHIRARAVVLGLPKSAIEQITFKGRDFEGRTGEQFREDIQAVRKGILSRVYASYPYPWWRRIGVTGGPGITMESLRMTYSLDTQGEQPGARDPNDQHSLFLVAFRQGPLPAEPRDLPTEVEREQAELRRLYGLSYIPGQEERVERQWLQGAWHRWQPGYDSTVVGARMRKPFERLRLHVVGEAWSQAQGWTEGALETCTQMLEEHYQLTGLPEGALALSAASPKR